MNSFDRRLFDEEVSEIQRYYADSTVFITGATGFLGRLLVEKLLRTCQDLKRIYVLLRPKRDKMAVERFEEYFKDVIFQRVLKEFPRATEKVSVIEGDCGLPDLGMSEEGKKILLSEVNCIFHSAAALSYNDKIKTASYINVRATRDLLRMAKRITNLTSFVYVSTAYSFCTQPYIGEEFYEPGLTCEQLLNLVEAFDDDEKLVRLTPIILGKWPNTYTFTKAVAEDVVRKEGVKLPVAIVRPSIIAGTTTEPIPGWIDNYYGITGIITGVVLGLVRTVYCKLDSVVEVVPADYVTSNILAVAWNNSSNSINKDTNNEVDSSSIIPIYNYVSSPEKPLSMRHCESLTYKYNGDTLSIKKVWHDFFIATTNEFVYSILHVVLHKIPISVMNALAFVMGRKSSSASLLQFMDFIKYFTVRQWTFQNTNTKTLWNRLNSKDRETFPFSMSNHDWDSYFSTYIPGIRQYLLKEEDPPHLREQRIALARNLKIVHYILMLLLGTGLIYPLIKIVFAFAI